MLVSDLSSVAQVLREHGYDARNLGQVAITVWRDGRGVYLSREELKHLNGDVELEVETRLKAQKH
jgi:hypothetical protein